MGIVIVKIKIMPTSLEANIEEIQKNVEGLLEKEGTKNKLFEIQPIAFGLNALILTFEWPEEKVLEDFENSLREIENVGSIEIIDMRRALG
ncbi:elongation factor 1-beta [Patescibacteria group bacterium]|nr:elongation factor 1-beta [Patescibacteria group bacterium]